MLEAYSLRSLMTWSGDPVRGGRSSPSTGVSVRTVLPLVHISISDGSLLSRRHSSRSRETSSASWDGVTFMHMNPSPNLTARRAALRPLPPRYMGG